jgi:hypothetical protein
MFQVRNIKIRTSLTDDFTDSGIMYVRNAGKQMVFDLEVQSAYPPGDETVSGGKIGRSHQLVNGPFMFHDLFARQRLWEGGFFDSMG